MEIQFFLSKTYIVDEFWHICSHLQSDKLFAKTGWNAIIFYGKKLNFHFWFSPIFGLCRKYWKSETLTKLLFTSFSVPRHGSDTHFWKGVKINRQDSLILMWQFLHLEYNCFCRYLLTCQQTELWVASTVKCVVLPVRKLLRRSMEFLSTVRIYIAWIFFYFSGKVVKAWNFRVS